MSVLEDVVIRRDRSVVTPSICSPPIRYTLFHSSPGWRVFTFSASFGIGNIGYIGFPFGERQPIDEPHTAAAAA